jgi:UDP-N-acetylmuramoyl-L-alanyl-D-glutamate--2,6-diaminopimelate ligase
MVRLSLLVGELGGVCTPAPAGALDRDVRDVHVDSRRVARGDLFAALPGLSVDGARFVPDALARGAAAVLSPRALEQPTGAAFPHWIHPDAPRAAGEAAALVHNRPARAQRVAGITGTNGKTTTAFFTGELARAAGFHPAVVGTVGYRLWGGAELPASHTTPDATELQRLLALNRAAGGDLFALEVSSHALDQDRVAGLELDVAVFTNLTRDHLDYHGTMEAYRDAKARIFRLLKADGTAVIHADDAHAEHMLAAARAAGRSTVTFGTGSRCDLCVSRTASGRGGIQLFLQGMGIQAEGLKLPLVGRHNVENAIAATAAVLLMGASPSRVLEGLASISSPPGRLEPVDTGARGFLCYVDYAHTPDALGRVLAALRPLVASPGRLIVVFGCGGDRDRGKRAPMGAVAAQRADVVLVTSDNPRGEEPDAIAREIERGAAAAGGAARVEVEIDRRAAIRRAFVEAREGDVVLIAGKGHETWQQVGGQKLPFDDRRVAAEELRR